jgi:hypothetical protein
VRILETRQEQPTVEVDHPGPRPDRWLDLAPVADSNDPSVPHRDGVRPRMFRIDRVNVAAAKDQVGGGVGHRSTMAHRGATAGHGSSGATTRHRAGLALRSSR